MVAITRIQIKDGALSYPVQVRVKRRGRLVFAQARIFPQLKPARNPAKRLEKQLMPGCGIEKRKVENRSRHLE